MAAWPPMLPGMEVRAMVGGPPAMACGVPALLPTRGVTGAE
jgi:hypothetical protein